MHIRKRLKYKKDKKIKNGNGFISPFLSEKGRGFFLPKNNIN